MITYGATLDVSRALVRRIAGLLAAERRRRGTRTGVRALSCWSQAVLALRWFRDRTGVDRLARDAGISQATGYRYLHEVIDVLAAAAPDVHEALAGAREAGLAYVILDGMVIATGRVAETSTSTAGKTIDAWYSGKHRHHGGNTQFLAAPDGYPLWVSGVEPGHTHDLTAAGEHVLGACYPAAAAGLPTLADKGYEGAGIGVHTPVKQPPDEAELHSDTLTYNSLLVRLRCLGERAAALLTTRWRTLQHITISPSRIGHIIQAAPVLTHLEHGRTH